MNQEKTRTSSLATALKIDSYPFSNQLDALQQELEAIPDTFYAAFWLYTHDFLYISPSIQNVTGHPYSSFEKHGMVYFTSLIPADRINSIYQAMYKQADKIQTHPQGLFSKSFLHINAAVLSKDKVTIPVSYNAVIVDEKAFDPISYLVLCSWIDTRTKTKDEVDSLAKELKEKLLEVKELYFKAKPERYEFIKIKNSISCREREVAKLLTQGHSTKSISDQLHISFNTVESHRKNLLQKLEAKNTAELVYKFNQV